MTISKQGGYFNKNCSENIEQLSRHFHKLLTHLRKAKLKFTSFLAEKQDFTDSLLFGNKTIFLQLLACRHFILLMGVHVPNSTALLFFLSGNVSQILNERKMLFL